MTSNLDAAYRLAAARYSELGVDTEVALAQIAKIPVSLHCWQGDDVGGFEPSASTLSGGIAATGNYPGKAGSADELRADAAKALSLIPGRHRFSLHATYGDFGGRSVDRDAMGPEHFAAWIDWAKALGIGLDFNPTFFSHPSAADNFTLAHRDRAVRDFWIAHGRRCRRIASGDGTRAWHTIRHEPLDSRRHEGHAGRSSRPARAIARVARRGVRGADRPCFQPRCG